MKLKSVTNRATLNVKNHRFRYGGCNLDIPVYVAIISFFRENVVVIAISELGPASNERYVISAFYGPFRFLIFILIFNKIL